MLYTTSTVPCAGLGLKAQASLSQHFTCNSQLDEMSETSLQSFVAAKNSQHRNLGKVSHEIH